MNIRKATEADLPGLCLLAFGQYVDERMYDIGMNFSYYSIRETLREIINDPDAGTVFIAEDCGGRPAGLYFCSYFPSYADECQTVAAETLWFVTPEYRGTGVGRGLYQATVNAAYEYGIRWMKTAFVYTSESHKGLAGWYEKMGFTVGQAEAFKVLTQSDYVV